MRRGRLRDVPRATFRNTEGTKYASASLINLGELGLEGLEAAALGELLADDPGVWVFTTPAGPLSTLRLGVGGRVRHLSAPIEAAGVATKAIVRGEFFAVDDLDPEEADRY